jgi:hypothetical protein
VDQDTLSAPEPFAWMAEREKLTSDEKRKVLQAMVDEWNDANPELATPFGRENLPRAMGMFPHGTGDVEQLFVDRFSMDDSLAWRIVGDIVRYVSSDEIPRGGRKSSLRKVQDKDKNLDAVWRITGLVKPPPSTLPFPLAARELIGKRSLRDFARAAGFGTQGGHRTLARYLSGEYALSMEALEAVAKAGRVDPSYFVEWRSMWVANELMHALLRDPRRSIAAVKVIREAMG